MMRRLFLTVYLVYIYTLLQKIEATEMLQYIADVRQAVKYAVSDMEGTELPGFSIPKKVNRRLCVLYGG